MQKVSGDVRPAVRTHRAAGRSQSSPEDPALAPSRPHARAPKSHDASGRLHRPAHGASAQCRPNDEASSSISALRSAHRGLGGSCSPPGRTGQEPSQGPRRSIQVPRRYPASAETATSETSSALAPYAGRQKPDFVLTPPSRLRRLCSCPHLVLVCPHGQHGAKWVTLQM